MANTSTAPDHPEQPIPKHLWKVAALSGMASYLDAALIVSISVNLAIYRDSYDMGVWMAGAISAIVTGCIAVGSLVGGRLADMFGRRRVYNLDIFCYALGAIVITLATNDIVLLAGVLVAGLAAGADLPTSLAVVSDAAPADGRARLVSFTQVMWVLGIVVAIFLGYVLSDTGMTGARIITGHLAVAALLTWQFRARLKPADEPSDAAVEEEAAAPAAPRGIELRNVWNRAALLPMAATFVYYVTWGIGANTFGQFGTYLLVTVSGASQSLATGINLAFLPIALVLTFFFVRVADKPRRDRLLCTAATVQVAAMCVASLTAGALVGMLVFFVLYQISNRSFGLSPLSRTPRTVLGALVPGVLGPGAATRIPCVVRAREAGSLCDLAMWVRPEATRRPRTISLVERGPRTLAPYPASQIARSR